ncbi:MAG: sigma 54-interacting transcriptional regulator [Magnetococcales bacterium]|nr:sigma 54-interacting transcriptional regulator [Magnetococcales bacterium]
MKPCETIKSIGSSPEFQAVERAARLVAVTDATLLILGDSGTGKELLALSIHRNSRRSKKPFIPVNCASLSETLAESELFGHTRGAFTGAIEERRGRIPAAHEGTLFLDEIGDMPLSVQAKVLRFMETGECQILGKEHPRWADVRVIAATNRNLAHLVGTGQFREDLFYRLQVVTLHLPPLRERGDDILLLAKSFLAHFAHRSGIAPPDITPAASDLLLRHDWPGNIRELRNLCERAVIFQGKMSIGADFVRGQLAAMCAGEKTGSNSHPGSREDLKGSQKRYIPHSGLSLEAVEKELIEEALARTNGNRTRAAKLLDLTRDALLYRMKKHALR